MKTILLLLLTLALNAVPTSGADTVVDDSAAGWIWSGMTSMDDPDFRGGTAHVGGPGSYGAYTFNGTGVDVYGIAGPNVDVDGRGHKMGSIKVSIDDNVKADTRMYRSDGNQQLEVCSITGLPAGNHVLQVVPDGGWAIVDFIMVHGGATTTPGDNGDKNSPSTTHAGSAGGDQSKPSSSTPTSAPIGKVIALLAGANQEFVSADYSPGKPLTADSKQASQLQSFEVEDGGHGYIALKSTATNMYVYVDPTDYCLYAGKATLDNTVSGGELFAWVPNPDGTVSLESYSTQLYVTTDISPPNQRRPGALYANKHGASGWEKYKVSVVSQ